MAMPLGMAMYLMRMVWFSLSGWIFTCVAIADEIAGSIRNGDIGPFHVGKGTYCSNCAEDTSARHLTLLSNLLMVAGKVLHYDTYLLLLVALMYQTF